MILRRYGSAYHSVDPDFNPAGLTEIGFRRNRAFSVAAAEFDESYARVAVRELSADADADVQGKAEAALLARLEQAVLDEAGRLEDGQALVILNDRADWPKTRERREVVREEDNRIRFHWSVEPALRVGVFERSGS